MSINSVLPNHGTSDLVPNLQFDDASGVSHFPVSRYSGCYYLNSSNYSLPIPEKGRYRVKYFLLGTFRYSDCSSRKRVLDKLAYVTKFPHSVWQLFDLETHDVICCSNDF